MNRHELPWPHLHRLWVPTLLLLKKGPNKVGEKPHRQVRALPLQKPNFKPSKPQHKVPQALFSFGVTKMGHESIKLDKVAHLQGSCVRSYSSNSLGWKRGVRGHDSPPKLQQLDMGSVKNKGELEKEKKLNFRPNAQHKEKKLWRAHLGALTIRGPTLSPVAWNPTESSVSSFIFFKSPSFLFNIVAQG